MFQIWKENSSALPSNRQLIKPWRHQLPVHIYSSLWLDYEIIAYLELELN